MSNGASATPIGWQPNMMARICTVVVVLFAVWAALGVSTPAGAADGNRLVKVFAVSDPARTGGQPDTLPSIASRTLGDPDRAGEIFDLNRGQAQRDGGALTAPTEQLHPGWILRLPEDATGPDVQVARETAGQNASSQPSEALAGAPRSAVTARRPAGPLFSPFRCRPLSRCSARSCWLWSRRGSWAGGGCAER